MVKVVGMVASSNRFGIIVTLAATAVLCVVSNVLWPSSYHVPCAMVVMAFECSPTQYVSTRVHRQQLQVRRGKSHVLETRQTRTNQQNPLMASLKDENYSKVNPKIGSKRRVMSLFGGLLLAVLITMNTATAFAGELTTANSGNENIEKSTVPLSIVSCSPSTGSPSNCVSTASVKQVDMFMLPWTWPESVSGDEVIGRLKGIIASDQTLSVLDSANVPAGNNFFFRIRAARNVCNDEIEILVNPDDRVMTFRSQQVDGPDNVSDFGANRRRLEEIRKRLKVVTVLGGGENAANGESTEGLTGQLKAFWGFQSGGGYESILLDEDE